MKQVFTPQSLQVGYPNLKRIYRPFGGDSRGIQVECTKGHLRRDVAPYFALNKAQNLHRPAACFSIT